MELSNGSIRRNALAKLARLSSVSGSDSDDMTRLSESLRRPKGQANGFLDGVMRSIAPISRVPMSIRELDVLLALCKAAPQLANPKHAERLVSQLTEYLPEAQTQAFHASPFLHDIRPSPWEALTYELTHALLRLGLRFEELRETISTSFQLYISNCVDFLGSTHSTAYHDNESSHSRDEHDAAQIACATVSLKGFLEAASESAHYWPASQRVEVIKQLQNILSEPFLVAVETASSTIRTSHSDQRYRDWRRYLKKYAASGSPVGAMLLQQGFMRFVLASTSRLSISGSYSSGGSSNLDRYLDGHHHSNGLTDGVDESTLEYLTEIISDEIRVLEEGSDYLQLSSAWQQRLAFSVKAFALEAFLHCMMIDEDIADADVLQSWLEDSLGSEVQMADENLAGTVLKCFAVLAKAMPENASNFARLLIRFIVQRTTLSTVVAAAAQSLSTILRLLSQDAVITTLYSLGNVLSSGSATEKGYGQTPEANGTASHQSGSLARMRTGSVISLSMSGDEDTSTICSNVAHAIVVIASSSKDSRIMALAQAMILQKIGKISPSVDARIIEESAVLAVSGKESEFRTLLRIYSRLNADALHRKKIVIVEAVKKAWLHLAATLSPKSPFYSIYHAYLLEEICSKGEIFEEDSKQASNLDLAAEGIAPLLRPLAVLVSRGPVETEPDSEDDDDIDALTRDAWYNMAVHGITLQSRLGQLYYHELRTLAIQSRPLVDEDRAELLETDVELNTILRRSMNAHHTTDQKKSLVNIIPSAEPEIRHLSYPKAVFLNAVFMLESLRARSGNCSEVLEYFLDPSMRESHMGSCMSRVADEIITIYLNRALPGDDAEFASAFVSKQLAQIFIGCCHRIAKVQQVARAAADRIVAQVPSALCQKSALFALLEILSTIWSACLDAELDEYAFRSTVTSARGKVTLELSDDYDFRKHTLEAFHSQARKWILATLAVAPLDVKGLLQTYLSEYDDTGTYGHVSLGRSLALEMGSAIPPLDQRLKAVGAEAEHNRINMASDFVAQYTTRQEYRYAGIPDHLRETQDLAMSYAVLPATHQYHLAVDQEVQQLLVEIESRVTETPQADHPEVRDVLRRAAALLCKSKRSQSSIVHHLVNIPFQDFNKASIKLGISLWLGVIHENPRMESRILTEIALAWERTIDRKVGIFSKDFCHLDPFYVKEEFAPSNKEALARQQQLVQSTISPHLRVHQFFESHFTAIRLGSFNTERTFTRMMTKTLIGLRGMSPHPLSREFHFQTVLFALQMLRFNTSMEKPGLWNFKDLILSAGLCWFKAPPAWSFGGNRLQIRAETTLLSDVLAALAMVDYIGQSNSKTRKSLQPKQELLRVLIETERNRLLVWLFPLDQNQADQSPKDAEVIPFLRTAWIVDPGIAIQLTKRFHSEQLRQAVRFHLLNFGHKAVGDADALEVLLGSSLPSDVTTQLKYLLYWAPVNPIQAVTYFLPSYGNDPFLLQYGMRALEHHSVDITFFYVPQIVQALRYDGLGYVERYIIEAGKMSQLFAHQIIWNMKANAFKDEDSQIPDPVKPTLDKVMNSLISSFSSEDRDFYKREFSFFNEVTDISGKLKPFVGRPKPEKKAKIEEELRKIKVEIGVYLPSNPDGVVVGIDRKSGKPLQSHAKAPFMATFRIRKDPEPGTIEANSPVEAEENKGKSIQLRPNFNSAMSTSDMSAIVPLTDGSYEVWQSAIFKVGDDCRQDVLALQMIAAFRGIFNSCGLDVYVFPYRVTATAPGCGVIDVLPNSISRDMLGREAVNGLYDYFQTKYGGEDSVRFQEARANFVKSMAAYSVISYLLQFKDRHNGNIMVDDAGHILHIDFGFCFDIAPGGVKFERAPFKLTPEMMAVMGRGSRNRQPYRWFEELTVKAFLACRPYQEKLAHLVALMLDSGLPCFKPETMANFRERFVLERSEGGAAEFMRQCIRKSEGNYSTKVYDEFQLLTNGIPY